MKNYRITVNGNIYDVQVEELGTSTAPAVSAPAATPAQVAPTTPHRSSITSSCNSCSSINW